MLGTALVACVVIKLEKSFDTPTKYGTTWWRNGRTKAFPPEASGPSTKYVTLEGEGSEKV